MTELEFINDLARKYANTCEFKSDFPHDWSSVNDGFIEGFKVAERLLSIERQTPTEANNNPETKQLIIADVSGSLHIDFAVWLTGHNEETIEQMFEDWNKRQ